MARILAIDWDGVEARFALGTVLKDRLIVSSVGSALIESAPESVAGAASELVASESIDDENGDGETRIVESDEIGEVDAGDADAEVVETVEKSSVPKTPVVYDDEEDEDEKETDGVVVSTVKKSKRESFKTSPLALTLKSLLREKKVGSAIVYYTVERGDVDVMHMTIPQTADSETPELVFNQALRDSLTFNETQPLDYAPLGLVGAKKTGVRRVAAVSIARDKLRRIREILSGAYRAPSKIELRETALLELLRADFCGLQYDDPVLLIQELCDEVNLVLCAEKSLLFFRSFKLQADSTPEYRANRIKDEVVRTLVVGIDDLPENVEVNHAVFFTGEQKPRAAGVYDSTVAEVGDEEEFAPQPCKTTATLLARALDEAGVNLDFINPFLLPGVKLKTTEPENPGRYASLLGVLLADRAQNKPVVDLLHPHEKPKPPNYGLLFAVYFLLVAIGFGSFWYWNKSDLKRLEAENVALEKERDGVAQVLNSKRPLYSTLASANAWQNVQGAVVLDELRDITTRLPSPPDLIVTRLSYVGNNNGRATFIINAKITSLDVYQLFQRRMAGDRSHQIQSAGPQNNVGGGGYKYTFTANIFCHRRPAQTFLSILPAQIREISANRPEYFVEQEKQRAKELKEAQEKAAAELKAKQEKNSADALAVLDKTAEVVAQGAPAQVVEGEAAPERTLEQEQEYVKRLEEFRKELDASFATAKAAFQQNGLTKEQAEVISTRYNEQVAVVAKAWNEARQRIQALTPAPVQPAPVQPVATETTPASNGEQASTEQASTEQPSSEGQAAPTIPTPEQDQAFAQRLWQYRQRLDANMKNAQAMLQQGQIDEARFKQIQAQYQAEVAKVVKNWNEVQARIKARASEGGSTPEATPAETPQPAAEPDPAEPAPQPAPESAPAEPAPQPAAEPAPAEPAPQAASVLHSLTRSLYV